MKKSFALIVMSLLAFAGVASAKQETAPPPVEVSAFIGTYKLVKGSDKILGKRFAVQAGPDANSLSLTMLDFEGTSPWIIKGINQGKVRIRKERSRCGDPFGIGLPCGISWIKETQKNFIRGKTLKLQNDSVEYGLVIPPYDLVREELALTLTDRGMLAKKSNPWGSPDEAEYELEQ